MSKRGPRKHITGMQYSNFMVSRVYMRVKLNGTVHNDRDIANLPLVL